MIIVKSIKWGISFDFSPVWKVYLYIFYNEYEKWEMEAACFGMNLSKIS